MAYSSAEGRQELLDTLAGAIDELGFVLASIAAAYEQLDDASADRLEEELFGPAQKAYGRAKRTYAEFAGRHGLEDRTFEQPSAGLPSTGAKGFIANAVEAAGQADHLLAEAQDSPQLLEVGDTELRAGLSAVRELASGISGNARELVRGLGR
jgi:hypothetical protein